MAKSKPRATSSRSSKAAPRVKPVRDTDPPEHDAAQTPKPQVVTTATHDEIARKAYEIWLAKGRPMGQEEQNWHEAEAAIVGTRQA